MNRGPHVIDDGVRGRPPAHRADLAEGDPTTDVRPSPLSHPCGLKGPHIRGRLNVESVSVDSLGGVGEKGTAGH